MFDSLTSIVNSMFNQRQTLEQMNVIYGFENIARKFISMPSLEVAPNLNFSSLIEEVGKNSNEAGTVLLSDGSPVAVIFNTEQIPLLNKIINFFPAVIQNMRDTLNHRIEFTKELQKLSVELLDTAGEFLHVLPYFILIGTILTVEGAFFLGKRYYEVENDQIKPKSKMSYIIPSAVLAFGIGLLALSVYGASRTSSNFLGVAKSLRAFPR